MKKKSPSDSHASLGPRLRLLRTARGLTMDQLSAMAGVSKAMLSQIEQSKVNPTVAVMLKIAGALKLSIGELVDDPRPHNILRVIEGTDDTYNFRSDRQCGIRTLSPLNLEKTIEFYRLALEPEGILSSESHFPGTEEILYLARGKLEIQCGEQHCRIQKGDSIHYRADLPHAIKNVGRNSAEAYLIVRYQEE